MVFYVLFLCAAREKATKKRAFSQPPQPLLTIMRGFNLSHALSSPGEGCNRSFSSLFHLCKLDPSEGRLDYVADATFDFCPHRGLDPRSAAEEHGWDSGSVAGMRGAARAESSLLGLCRVATISLKAMRDKVPPMICCPDGANDIPANPLPFRGRLGGGY